MSLEMSPKNTLPANHVQRVKVVSARRLVANRANALKSTGPRTPKGKAQSVVNAGKSTGPRTPAGKARSSRNAFRHGVWAEVPIADVDAPSYRAQFLTVVREHALRSPEELIWGTAVAQTQWLLARLEAEQIHACQNKAAGDMTFDDLTKYMDAECRLSSRLIMLLGWRTRSVSRVMPGILRHVSAGPATASVPPAARCMEERSQATLIRVPVSAERAIPVQVVRVRVLMEEGSQASAIGASAAVEEGSQANAIGASAAVEEGSQANAARSWRSGVVE